jgi:hypothetical protein
MNAIRPRARRLYLWLILIALPLLGQRQTEMFQGREVSANEVLVKLRTTSPLTLPQIQTANDIGLDKLIGAGRQLHLMRSRSLNVTSLINALSGHPDVLYVEPNYIVRATTEPNDPDYGQLWGLQNIAANAAWEISTGSTANAVAVVDSGIDYTHPDLTANVWSAPASFTVNIGGQAINCAAGTHGFNAILMTCDPMDDNGHGTYVSGILGAVGNNGLGVTGVNWTTVIMATKFLASDGTGTTADAVNAIEFAIQANAVFAGSATPVNVRVLSASWGGTTSSTPLLDEVEEANTNNMLFVAAAGNSGTSNDTSPTYPANFTVPNVISVASNDDPDSLSYFSNYGPTTVDLSAPGSGILSTWPGATYEALSGTSASAPFVSGAALLVLSSCPMNTASLKQLLLADVAPVPAMAGLTVTGGRLSVDNAIRDCTHSPSAYTVATTQSLAPPSGVVTVSWSVPTGQASNDWIGLFQTGTPNTAYLTFQFTNGAPAGNFTFTAPAQPGQYEFRYLLQNGYVSEAKSGTFTVSTSVVAPVVSAVQATNVTSSGATITWTTSTATSSLVEYGLTTSYGSVTTLNPTLVTSHMVTLSNLTPTTTYHYAVQSVDASGILAQSGDFSFTTLPSAAGFSVSATPATVNLGGTITVSWTAPAGRPTNDWVALYAVGAPDTSYLWFQYTGGATSGTANAPAPTQGGQYEFRYLLQNGYTDIVRSNTVTVTVSGFTLVATPSTVSPGGSVSVSWTAPSGRPTNDWIGLYAAGAADTSYLAYQYTGGATSGSVNMVMPTQTGQYQFRYLLQNGYTDVVRSNAVSVASSGVTPTISAVLSSNVTASGATITWTTNEPTTSQVAYGPTTSYGSVTAANTTLVTTHSVPLSGLAAGTPYHYQVTSTDASANIAVSGDYTFTTAASGAGYTLTATPSTVSVGASITVAWTAPAGSATNDWVGLFQVGAANTAYISFQYTGGATTGSFSLAAPGSAGQYEFRYLLQNAYTSVATSNAVTVSSGSGSYTLAASPADLNPGGALTISWTAPSGRPTNDWIGLFEVGAANTAYVWDQYTGGAASGTFNLTAPSPLGQYEFRYFLQNGYTLATTSNAVTVNLTGSYSLTATPASVSPGGTLTINWSAPSGRPTNDWVGLFLVGAPNTSYLGFQYTGGATSGTFKVAAPGTTGQYEFRYLLQNGYTSVATSNAVTDQ